MNRVTLHQALPQPVIRERVKQRLFRFMYEHDDRDFLGVIADLLYHMTESTNYYGASGKIQLDIIVDQFLIKFDESVNLQNNKDNDKQ